MISKTVLKYLVLFSLSLIIVVGGVSSALAQGSGFTYQGELQDNGAPVNDVCDFRFSLWDAATDGNRLGDIEEESNVTVANGRFVAILNDSNQFGAQPFNGAARFLEIAVRCPAGTNDFTTLAPRQPLLAVPYAHYAQPAQHDHVGEQWTINDAATGLTVTNSSANAAAALVGNITTSNGAGVFGGNGNGTGSGIGVRGESFGTTGVGVVGNAVATNGQNIGVRGLSKSTGGTGVYGEADATSGTTYGVRGINKSNAGIGVYGEAQANNGTTYGLYGRNNSTQGRGVFGQATANSGLNYGVYGQTKSGAGVFGEALATTGATYGVHGVSDSINGTGVRGVATANSGTNYGVFGQTNSPNGYAGYFQGNVHVQGTLSKASGSFKIDHPLDPENKYLYHSFVESPDMMNIYNGNVTLDKKGAAWVELPEWFGALNQEYRYQLTAIGGPGPNLYIAQEIKNNRFQIAGGEPGTKVSWQVTGIRHDPYAEANRIPVEEVKPQNERGTYLHPEAYGQPDEKGLAGQLAE